MLHSDKMKNNLIDLDLDLEEAYFLFQHNSCVLGYKLSVRYSLYT